MLFEIPSGIVKTNEHQTWMSGLQIGLQLSMNTSIVVLGNYSLFGSLQKFLFSFVFPRGACPGLSCCCPHVSLSVAPSFILSLTSVISWAETLEWAGIGDCPVDSVLWSWLAAGVSAGLYTSEAQLTCVIQLEICITFALVSACVNEVVPCRFNLAHGILK